MQKPPIGLSLIAAGAAALFAIEVTKDRDGSPSTGGDTFSETDKVLAEETARWSGPEGAEMLDSLQQERSPEVQAQMEAARARTLKELGKPGDPRIVEIHPESDPYRYGPQGLARLIQATAKTHNLQPGDAVRVGEALHYIK